MPAGEHGLADVSIVLGGGSGIDAAYSTSIDSQPVAVFVFSGNVKKELSVAGVAHSSVDVDLVACHVMRDDGQTLDEVWVHCVGVNVD